MKQSLLILAIISLAFNTKLYAQSLTDSIIKYPVEFRDGTWRPKNLNDSTFRIISDRSSRDTKYLGLQVTPWVDEVKFRGTLRLNTWKLGLIDTIGRVIIEPEWDFFAMEECDEMILVSKDATLNERVGDIFFSNDGKSGYIDLQGNVIIPIDYSWIGYFYETNVVAFTKSGKLLPDKSRSKRENKRSNRRYLKSLKNNQKPTVLGGVEDYLIKPFSNAKYGLINRKGEIVLPETYDDIRSIQTFAGDNAFLVLNKDKFGAIDLNGEVIVPVIYDNYFAVRYLVEEYYQTLKREKENAGADLPEN